MIELKAITDIWDFTPELCSKEPHTEIFQIEPQFLMAASTIHSMVSVMPRSFYVTRSGAAQVPSD